MDTGALVLPLALLGDQPLLIWESCAELGGTRTSCLGEPRSQMPPRELGGWEVNPLFEDPSPGQAVCLCIQWAEGILGVHEGTSWAHGPTCYVAGGQRVPLLGLSFHICLVALRSVDRDESTANGSPHPHGGQWRFRSGRVESTFSTGNPKCREGNGHSILEWTTPQSWRAG